MSLNDLRPRHVYVASAAAFILLAGFEGVRMAAGHDPALAEPVRTQSVPTPAAPAPPSSHHHDGLDPGDPGSDPGAQGGSDPGEVPQPESRLS